MAISSRRGSTFVELAIVMLLIGLLGTILIPAIQRAKEKSQRSRCAYNLRRIIHGVVKYENSQGSFPPGRLFPDRLNANGDPIVTSNYSGVSPGETSGYYSVHIWILPYVKAGHIFDLIDFDVPLIKILHPGNPNTEAFTQPMPLYLCPSDSDTSSGLTDNNYRCNFGGDTPGAGQRTVNSIVRNPRPSDLWHPGGNGAFTLGETGPMAKDTGLMPKDFVDGISKTVFFSERTKGAGDSFRKVPTITDMIRCPGRGITPADPIEFVFQAAESYVPEFSHFVFTNAGRWSERENYSNGWPFAGYDSTQYNHVAPPNWNSIDCGVSFISDTPGEHAIIAARSEHPRFVNVAYGDGHVKAINDEIDLTVWRALGTRNGGETVPEKKRRRRNRW